jgi:hypothetical protein
LRNGEVEGIHGNTKISRVGAAMKNKREKSRESCGGGTEATRKTEQANPTATGSTVGILLAPLAPETD